MSDEEFDVIDELYFVTPYKELKSALDFTDNSLQSILINLIEKGWVKLFVRVDEEADLTQVDINKDFQSCFFLASKKGLFEHNTQ